MSLLAFLLGVVTFGGSAVVFLYDLLEARLAGEPASDEGGGARRARRTHRLLPARPVPAGRGVVFTVRAGSQQARGAAHREGRGEAASG
jgi:hypothetical protein